MEIFKGQNLCMSSKESVLFLRVFSVSNIVGKNICLLKKRKKLSVVQ